MAVTDGVTSNCSQAAQRRDIDLLQCKKEACERGANVIVYIHLRTCMLYSCDMNDIEVVSATDGWQDDTTLGVTNATTATTLLLFVGRDDHIESEFPVWGIVLKAVGLALLGALVVPVLHAIRKCCLRRFLRHKRAKSAAHSPEVALAKDINKLPYNVAVQENDRGISNPAYTHLH